MVAQRTTTKAATKRAGTKSAATKSTAKSSPKKAPSKAATARSGAAPRKTTAKAPAATAGKSPVKAPSAKSSATKTAPAKTASAKGAAAAKPAKAVAKTAAKKPASSRLSAADVKEFTALISGELDRIRTEHAESMKEFEALKNAGQDSSGDDPADAGTQTFEREQAMSIANNRRDLIVQMERALARIEAGTYGVCESCGSAIPKARLQAFPQATLCVDCKAREERR